MTYDPYHQPPASPYQQQPGGPYQQPGAYPPPQPMPRRSDDGANMVIRIVRVITTITTSIFLLHIAFVVLKANQANEFVAFIYAMARTLVLGLGDVFTPADATIGVILNYGFAAIVYLVIGQLIIKALRRP